MRLDAALASVTTKVGGIGGKHKTNPPHGGLPKKTQKQAAKEAGVPLRTLQHTAKDGHRHVAATTKKTQKQAAKEARVSRRTLQRQPHILAASEPGRVQILDPLPTPSLAVANGRLASAR